MEENEQHKSSGMSSGQSHPPNPLPAEYRQCLCTDCEAAPSKRSLVRNLSLMKTKVSEVSAEPEPVIEHCKAEFLPNLRSGACADIGFRSSMEDVYLCVDNFLPNFGPKNHIKGPNAFYGVFDGHGGKHAADFACDHLPKFIVEDESFPSDIEKIVASAFWQTDNAFVDACSLDADLASGTTALAALVIGRAEELETALMEAVNRDNRQELIARVEQLEQEVTELQQFLAGKKEQEVSLLKVLAYLFTPPPFFISLDAN